MTCLFRWRYEQKHKIKQKNDNLRVNDSVQPLRIYPSDQNVHACILLDVCEAGKLVW